MKENEILFALEAVDEEYLEEAKPMKNKFSLTGIISVAAGLLIVVGVALWIGLGLGNDTPVAEKPFPEPPRPGKSLASVMADYLLSSEDDEYDNVFPDGDDWFDNDIEEEVTPEGSNGSYVEVTDNQVAGIIEGDLYKTTDKYIFRYRKGSLYIYSIDGENSAEISVTPIVENNHPNIYDADMFLSMDGNTITLIRQEYVTDKINVDELYYYYSGHYVTKIHSIDVSDVKNPVISKTLEISGSNKDVRKIGDKIYLVTSPQFRKGNIEIDVPETYIPSITSGDEVHLCELEKIYYPDEITSASYHYVTVFDEEDLSLASEYAILTDYGTYNPRAYFTDNHILLEFQGGNRISEEEATSEAYSWLELIDFSGDTLRYRGSFEMKGWAESGQYSYDEQNGYLRVVVSTRIWKRYRVEKSSASLYVFDLSTMSLAASVEDFAPEGERATAVRFDGDKLYVCTADTAKYTDPVFFFDLSDYENITQVNTGFIEGFSSSLIDIGEGYLLGIGRENASQSKIEIYKREGDAVVSVAKQLFSGNYDSDYHSYLIDRENNLFGLALSYIREGYGVSYGHGYFLWRFDNETESISLVAEMSGDTDRNYYGRARSFVRDGYLYLTSTNEFDPLIVKKIDFE